MAVAWANLPSGAHIAKRENGSTAAKYVNLRPGRSLVYHISETMKTQDMATYSEWRYHG